MTIKKVKVNESEYIFEIDDTDPATEPLEIYDRFGASKFGVKGFFAQIEFGAAFTGIIETHLGPTKDKQAHLPELDLVINADAGPHTIDIGTRAHYVKLVCVTGFPFTATITIAR